MIPALNEISAQQYKPTPHTINKCNRLIYYTTAYPDDFIRYHVSDMILHIDNDAA